MLYTIYIYTQAVNSMVDNLCPNCTCLCLKREHVVERTLQSITQIMWVFIILIYHHRKKG